MLLLHVVDDRAETETPPSQNVYRQSRSLQVRTSLQRRLLSPSCIAPPCHSALFACHRGIALDGSQRRCRVGIATLFDRILLVGLLLSLFKVLFDVVKRVWGFNVVLDTLWDANHP